MVHLEQKRFSKGKHKKLHSQTVGPSNRLTRLGHNAYVLKLSEGLNISLIFNVEDITIYHGHYEY